jgi:hypothetical protein
VNPIWLIVIGIAVGVYSGIMGLGGGTIMIPILVLALGFGQHKAVATSLAVMIPPVTLPAVIKYYREGHVDPWVAAWIAVGVLFGTPAGAAVAGYLSDRALRLVFGFVLVYIAGYTIFQTLGKQHLMRSIALAAVLVVASAAFFLAVRWYDASQASQQPPASAPSTAGV